MPSPTDILTRAGAAFDRAYLEMMDGVEQSARRGRPLGAPLSPNEVAWDAMVAKSRADAEALRQTDLEKERRQEQRDKANESAQRYYNTKMVVRG